MKRLFLPTLLLTSSLTAAINNTDVIRMVNSTTPLSEILHKIESSQTNFHLWPGDVRRLRDHHVPELIIEAMSARNRQEFIDPLNHSEVLEPYTSPGDPRPSSHYASAGLNPSQTGSNGAVTHQRQALMVSEGTPIRLRLTSNLSAAYLRVDDRVRFEVLEDVLVKNSVGRFLAVEREAPAYGTVTQLNKTQLIGRYGTVEIAMDYVMLANGDKVALRGTQRADRHIRPGTIVFSLAPIGYIVQPKDPVWLTPLGHQEAILKDGIDFTVYTDGVANLDSSQFETR